MVNLFSDQNITENEQREAATRQQERETLERWKRQSEIDKRHAQQERDLQIFTDIIYQFQTVSLTESSPKQKIQQDSELINNFLVATTEICQRHSDLKINAVPLIEGTREYGIVKQLFTSTNKHFFKIQEIFKVNNPYLLLQYKLKKMQNKERYGHVEERYLFHGTKTKNVASICRNNFEWRLTGKSTGHKFGQGVSFTSISNYATNYGDKTFEKVMILAKVLVSNKCRGHKEMKIPLKYYDTSTNESEQVFVKYEDNSFYPAYVIYYSGFDYSKSGQSRKEIMT